MNNEELYQAYKKTETGKLEYLTFKESKALAEQLNQKYQDLTDKAWEEIPEVPEVDEENFEEKMEIHGQFFDIWFAYSQLAHSTFNYAFCKRRSQKMGWELTDAIYDAIKLGLTVF